MDIAASIAVLVLAVAVLVRLVRQRPDFVRAPLITGILIGLAFAVAAGLLVSRWFDAPTADLPEAVKLIDVQRKDIAEIGRSVAGLDNKLGALQAEGEALNRKVRQIDARIEQIDGSLKTIEPI